MIDSEWQIMICVVGCQVLSVQCWCDSDYMKRLFVSFHRSMEFTSVVKAASTRPSPRTVRSLRRRSSCEYPTHVWMFVVISLPLLMMSLLQRLHGNRHPLGWCVRSSGLPALHTDAHGGQTSGEISFPQPITVLLVWQVFTVHPVTWSLIPEIYWIMSDSLKRSLKKLTEEDCVCVCVCVSVCVLRV